MKNTNFERVFGDHNAEKVEIHRKKRYAHWQLKLLSLVLAFLFWLVITNVDQIKEAQQHQNNAPADAQTTECQ